MTKRPLTRGNLAPATLMGIVNVTPDSFSDGGQFADVKAALAHGLKLADEGATILDIGGESTRPGSRAVSVQEELDRVLPVIEALSQRHPAPISIDTRKPQVARAAVNAGASIWNDVSALTFAEDSLPTAAALNVPLILMHAKGDPTTMQDAPQYDDVVAEVCTYLRARRDAAVKAGASAENIILDPGIGFGKTLAHNVALMQNLLQVVEIGQPVLLGASRKRFIATIDREGEAEDRLGGSIAAALVARAQGVGWFRVHDVAATRQALAVWDATSSHTL